MNPSLKARLSLTLITIIWGSTFPLSKIVLEQLPPFLYLFIRYGLATLIMLLIFGRTIRASWRSTWRLSLPIGLVLGLAYLGQTAGIDLTTASKAGFFTGLSVVLVPIFQALWLKEPPAKAHVLSALIATLGLALLSDLFSERPDLNFGDLLVIASAAMFALHILFQDRLPLDCPRETIVSQQFLCVALIALPLTLVFEPLPQQMPQPHIWLIVLFLCLVATVLAFAVQAWAQKHISANNTAIILILEPVFSSLFSWIWLGEQLGPIGWIGAAFIVLSMIGSSMELGKEARPERGEP